MSALTDAFIFLNCMLEKENEHIKLLDLRSTEPERYEIVLSSAIPFSGGTL